MYLKLATLLMSTAVAFASGAVAQQTVSIDTQLAENLDLRDVRFRACFGVRVCEVDGYRILAWHRESDWQNWHAALLHWDPVDGIGVLDGGQDDEIDYNERVVIEFPYQQNVYGVWLSDLFINEDSRYIANETGGGAFNVENTAETAGIEFRRNGGVARTVQVSGNLALPDDTFNERIASQIFSEGGDLRQRLVIRDGAISVLSASLNSRGDRRVVSTVAVDQLDPEKQDLFAGRDGVEYDLSALMSDGLEFTLEDEGSSNINRINAILDDPTLLSQINEDARVARTIGDVSNGEVLTSWIDPVPTTSVMFQATAGTSNDFSIAGVVFTRPNQ